MEQEIATLKKALADTKVKHSLLLERFRTSRTKDRERELNTAFDLFDLDGDEELSEEEFFHIGKVRGE